MNRDIQEILISEKRIEEMVTALAEQINEDFKDKEIILVGLLKGSVVFMSDILRKINMPCSIDFMIASSYGSGTMSSGVVKISKDLSVDIENKNVIIIANY